MTAVTPALSADAEAAIAAIRETHRKWKNYTARLSKALRDDGWASDNYAYYRELQQAHEVATQQQVGVLLAEVDRQRQREIDLCTAPELGEATHKRELQSLKHLFELWQGGDILINSTSGLEGIHLLRVYLEEMGVIPIGHAQEGGDDAG